MIISMRHISDPRIAKLLVLEPLNRRGMSHRVVMMIRVDHMIAIPKSASIVIVTDIRERTTQAVLRVRIYQATSTSQKAAVSCDFFNKVSFRQLSLLLRLLEMWAIVYKGLLSGFLQIKCNRAFSI